MHRRSFLTGIATTLLAGTAAPRLIEFKFSTASAFTLRTTIPAGEVYGRSPAMDALQGMLEILQRHPEMTAGQMIDAAHCCTARGNPWLTDDPARSSQWCVWH